MRLRVFIRSLFIYAIFLAYTKNCISQTSIPNLSQKFETNKVSVLMIYTAQDTSVSQGSAFLISSSGLAISNYHVFKNMNEAIAIDHSGSKYGKISIVYADEALDFIVFQIPGITLPPLTIAKGQPSIGEPCFAIGNPLGLDLTLSTGIISGYRENDNYIQTSAEITHGSSGGPLFNAEGEVIGITTAGAGQANLNFAVNLLKIDIDFVKNRISALPDKIVRQFLVNLGNQQFGNAYALSDNPVWIKNGGQPWFSSNKAYGGIVRIDIKEIRAESMNSSKATVYAHYYSEDPLHTSRFWEQNFYLEKKHNGWVITKVKLK